jgi:hypothetical protein
LFAGDGPDASAAVDAASVVRRHNGEGHWLVNGHGRLSRIDADFPVMSVNGQRLVFLFILRFLL